MRRYSKALSCPAKLSVAGTSLVTSTHSGGSGGGGGGGCGEEDPAAEDDVAGALAGLVVGRCRLTR